MHPGQVAAYNLPGRFKAIRCGRRWGKTGLAKIYAIDGAIKARTIGIFAPDYKRLSEVYNEIAEAIEPVLKTSSKTEGVIRTTTGGRIDFWTLEDESAGRSRYYHLAIIDEAAFAKPNMLDIWQRAIRPTLLDYRGSALVFSNTNGDDFDNFFWKICNQKELGFVEYHAPTHQNPHLPAEELLKLQADNPPLVYQQEYLAEFVDWSGSAFFSRESLLNDGQPIETPNKCDTVFAIIDSATKTGKDNDGTAVCYFSLDNTSTWPLTILDWDVIQIEGALLETWLPTVFESLENFAKTCGARMGSVGAHIEDKASGMVLIQQALRRGWPASAIDSKLTSVGKDERAISVSGYVYRHRVKLSRQAFEKTTAYKGVTRNHLLSQIVGFRVGDKDAAKRADDLLDAFCYGVALGLGNAEGF